MGKIPIAFSSDVKVQVVDGFVKISGPKGELMRQLPSTISLEVNNNVIIVKRGDDEKPSRSLHGLFRSLIAGMITGVTDGFSKKLEVNGVGYKINANGQNLKLSLGFSHDIDYLVPEGVRVSVEQNIVTVEGIDKQMVGQVASEIRAFKKPEPYKGKGIRYVGEQIIRKTGKAAGAGAEE